jgi:hypothetical protein
MMITFTTASNDAHTHASMNTCARPAFSQESLLMHQLSPNTRTHATAAAAAAAAVAGGQRQQRNFDKLFAY